MESLIVILIVAFVVGIFSFMVKSGVFNVDKSEQDSPGSVMDNSDRIDSLGTKGVVAFPGLNNEDAETKHKALLNQQKYLMNSIYALDGNPDKMNERYALKAELKKLENELSKHNLS